MSLAGAASGGADLGLGETFEMGLDVLGGELVAVSEEDVVSETPRPRRVVLVGLPRLGDVRFVGLRGQIVVTVDDRVVEGRRQVTAPSPPVPCISVGSRPELRAWVRVIISPPARSAVVHESASSPSAGPVVSGARGVRASSRGRWWRWWCPESTASLSATESAASSLSVVVAAADRDQHDRQRTATWRRRIQLRGASHPPKEFHPDIRSRLCSNRSLAWGRSKHLLVFVGQVQLL